MAVRDRVAVVTGGASGIGRGVCVRLSTMGMRVAVLDVNEPGMAETIELIGTPGAKAFSVDVSDTEAVDAALAAVRAALGPVTVLVNVAGIGEFLPFTEMTRAAWDRMLAVHLTGTFNCTRAAVPDMLAAGWGRIVNTSSVAGLNGGGPGLSHYAAAKGGIVGFSKALAHELGPSGITVNCVAPGLIETRREGAAPQHHATRTNPLGRRGTPEEVAAAVRMLCGAGARYITGQTLHVNGGAYMA